MRRNKHYFILFYSFRSFISLCSATVFLLFNIPLLSAPFAQLFSLCSFFSYCSTSCCFSSHFSFCSTYFSFCSFTFLISLLIVFLFLVFINCFYSKNLLSQFSSFIAQRTSYLSFVHTASHSLIVIFTLLHSLINNVIYEPSILPFCSAFFPHALLSFLFL
jgi:hypothetical protein